MIEIHWEFGDYAYAYRSAARRLVAAASSDEELGSQLSLPTVYLYRHALELALKDTIVWTEITISQGSEHGAGQSVDEVRGAIQGHRLWPLVDRLLDRYRLVDPNLNPTRPLDLREAVEPAITAADTLDADGQRLRYPYVSKGLERSWSVERLAPTRTRVAEISRRIETALDQLLDVLGPWFADTLDHAIEQAWIAQLWEAERRARSVEAMQLSIGSNQRGDAAMQGDADVVDDLKADLSAYLLDVDVD